MKSITRQDALTKNLFKYYLQKLKIKEGIGDLVTKTFWTDFKGHWDYAGTQHDPSRSEVFDLNDFYLDNGDPNLIIGCSRSLS